MKFSFSMPVMPSFTESVLSGAGAITGALVLRNLHRLAFSSASSSHAPVEALGPHLEEIFMHDYTIQRGKGEPDNLDCYYHAVKTYYNALENGQNSWQAIISADREGKKCVKEEFLKIEK